MHLRKENHKKVKTLFRMRNHFAKGFCVIEKIYMKGGDGDVKGKKYWDGQVFL